MKKMAAGAINAEGCNTVPIEKGTETVTKSRARTAALAMQHRPHREGD